MFGGLGYQDADKCAETANAVVDWHIAMKRGQRRMLANSAVDWLRYATEKVKVRVPARGEHSFHVVKNLLGHRKVRYRSIAKRAYYRSPSHSGRYTSTR
ncbi:transposase, IS5 family [Aquisalimonas asiatica]|uniref:Transposase, IS5 family n=1 Tax=Aquisalimonas asiatica TaxID=406100 RepID=A0A1H8QUF3_9GAMM|nr:transposase, IS5 family [Aquisalimonas asiatica]